MRHPKKCETRTQRWAENKEWSLAAERTNDLIEQVAQFAGSDAEILGIIEVLRTSRLVMLTKRQGAGQKFPMEEFQSALGRLQQKVHGLRNPFAPEDTSV